MEKRLNKTPSAIAPYKFVTAGKSATHQPIEMNCTKKQPSYARLISNDVAELLTFVAL